MALPSYQAKLARAKEHLIDLEDAVTKYAGTHPYAVRQRIEGNRERPVFRVEFTRSPGDTLIPILAADVVYNLRSALDHLMAALVAPKDRGSAMFPIYFHGVWDAIVPGEDQQRIKQRLRWASDVKTLSDDAIAVLKQLQPPDPAPDESKQEHLLRLINRLSNRDKHEKLPVVTSGLSEITATVTLANGTVENVDVLHGYDALQDHAVLNVSPEAVDVQVQGVPLVAIKGKFKDRYVPIPRLNAAGTYIEHSIAHKLAPYIS